jgi:hypothetical protein
MTFPLCGGLLKSSPLFSWTFPHRSFTFESYLRLNPDS